MKTLMLILATVTLPAPTGCAHWRGVDDQVIAERQRQARDAEQEAIRRCPTGEVEVRPDRLGRDNDRVREGRIATSPIDYRCKGPGQ